FFYGAFFPQFVVTSHDVGAQVAILSTTFLLLAVVLDGCWALAAGRARGLLAMHGRLRNRISGSLLVGAVIGLALARKSGSDRSRIRADSRRIFVAFDAIF